MDCIFDNLIKLVKLPWILKCNLPVLKSKGQHKLLKDLVAHVFCQNKGIGFTSVQENFFGVIRNNPGKDESRGQNHCQTGEREKLYQPEGF